jgi:uncharacterized protein (DUF2252 family)
MIAARLLERAVVIRELMPQDLKIDMQRLNGDEAASIARYLAGIVGRAHGRQMDLETRNAWRAAVGKRRKAKLDAPSWLWLSVVDLMGAHEAAYLEHCRRYALSQAA